MEISRVEYANNFSDNINIKQTVTSQSPYLFLKKYFKNGNNSD